MNNKTIKIWFWIVTVIFCLANLFAGITEVMKVQSNIDLMIMLGYPIYFLTILGTGKIIGSLVLIQTRYSTIREWAYAGFTIDYIAAAWSNSIMGGGVMGVLVPLIFLTILFINRFLWKKYEDVKEI